ncbi:MAG: hypothetical protein K9J17_02080 [Flavobacteriales bacterium]|nr:hypothetical protein [Flavobacteriales bacterium]
MSAISPFSIEIYGALSFSLVAFYFLGSILAGGAENPIESIGIKLSIGALFFISMVATIHAGLGTGMVFFFLLFIIFGFSNRFRPDFSDLIELGLPKMGLIILVFFVLTSIESWRSNLVSGENIYIGNSDVSYYGANGHLLFVQGVETFPENLSPNIKPNIYHYGDLWFSGFYSYYFNVLPYYAYNVLFRSLCIGFIFLSVFGWIQQNSKRLLPLVGSLVVFGSVYLEIFPINWPDSDIFQLFSSLYPMYGLGSHMIVALAGIAFAKFGLEKNWVLGTIGLLFLPFLNGGLLITPILMMMCFCVLVFTVWLFRKEFTYCRISELILLTLTSFLPLIYYKLGGRMDPPGSSLFSGESVYLMVHTMVRLLLSQFMVIPFLFGALFFWNKRTVAHDRFLLLQFSLYVGALTSFAIIFPQVRGNSIQIVSIHFQGFLVPLGIVGLMGLATTTNIFWQKWCAILSLSLILFQSARVWVSTEGIRATFDWESYLPGYKKTHLLSQSEWRTLSEIWDKSENRIGYFIDSKTEGDLIRYTRFNHYKGIFPGTIFLRMNTVASDFTMSKEETGYFKRTGLGYFSDRSSGDEALTSEEFMEFLEPDFLMVAKNGQSILPEEFQMSFTNEIETESFIVYRNSKKRVN